MAGNGAGGRDAGARVHPVARSLATLEAVTGSLYVAILIARLVSQAVVSPGPGRDGPEYDPGASSRRTSP